MKETTLCYIENDERYLMLHRIKKQADVNKGKWIGVGGKLESGEAPEECLIREVKEETGLTLNYYDFRGVLTFCCDGAEDEYIFLYTSNDFQGQIQDCNEGILEWVEKDKVFNLNLWEGDKIMFRLLNTKTTPFSLKLVYKNDRLVSAEEF